MFFELNGVSASSLGLMLLDAPAIQTPAERGESVIIPGRSGDIWQGEGALDSVRVPLKFWLMPSGSEAAAREYLSSSGKMRLDHSTYYYDFRVDGEAECSPLLGGNGYLFNMTAVLSPYRQESEMLYAVFNSSSTISNNGDMDCYPVLTIAGSGACQITLNGYSFGFDVLPGSPTHVDCLSKECFVSSTIVTAQMDGEFPVLKPGVNAISFSGGVESVVVRPRFRKRVQIGGAT